MLPAAIKIFLTPGVRDQREEVKPLSTSVKLKLDTSDYETLALSTMFETLLDLFTKSKNKQTLFMLPESL